MRLAQRCAETLLEMGFGMQAFQELQIDMIDSLLGFFSLPCSLIRGKKKKKNPHPIDSGRFPIAHEVQER